MDASLISGVGGSKRILQRLEFVGGNGDESEEDKNFILAVHRPQKAVNTTK